MTGWMRAVLIWVWVASGLGICAAMGSKGMAILYFPILAMNVLAFFIGRTWYKPKVSKIP